jgi:hypothetical protein
MKSQSLLMLLLLMMVLFCGCFYLVWMIKLPILMLKQTCPTLTTRQVLDISQIADACSPHRRDGLVAQFNELDLCFATSSDLPKHVQHKNRCLLVAALLRRYFAAPQ